MMRKKISWLFLLTVFLALFSCRNEQDILNEASANRKRDIISFSAFQKETQIQKVGEVISPISTAQKNSQHDDPLSGFLIDTETINRIKANGDISTYAFRIYSLFGNPQDVYNMVYRKRNDGTLHYSIIRIIGNIPYVLYDSEAASAAQKHSHKNAVAKTSSYEDCLASYSVSVWHCKNGHSWDTCDKCPECLETLTVCVGSGGGDNSGGFGGPSNGNPSSPPPPVDPITEGGSAAYLTDPSGYVFDPNVPPSTDEGYVRALRAYLFSEQLPGATYHQWASGNAGIYQNIIESYLNNYSTANNTENLNFHNQAVQYFMDHPNATWEDFNLSLNEDSCDVLNTNSNNTVFEAKLDSLKQRVMTAMDTHETQINIEKTGQKFKYTVSRKQSNTSATTISVKGKGSNYDIASMHNHTADGIPIFSYDDIVAFYDMYKYVVPFRKTAYTFYLVCANGNTYALRMQDTSSLDALFAGINLGTDTTTQADLDKAYKIVKEDIFAKYGDFTKANNPNLAETFFMKVINDPKLGGGNGLNIYRKGGSTWGKMKLNPNGMITTEDCP